MACDFKNRQTYELNLLLRTVPYGLVLFVLFFVLLVPRVMAREETLEAPPPEIFLNEIMWRGSSVSIADEWLELYSQSEEVVDLSGWEIYDEVKGATMVKIPSGQIAPGGYFLISNNSKNHIFKGGESILDVDPDIVDSKVSLSNTKFRISLRDGDGEVIDGAGDGKKPFYGECAGAIASMQRKDYGESGDEAAAWDNFLDESGTQVCPESKNLDEGASEIASPEPSGRPRVDFFETLKTAFARGGRIVLEIDYEIFDHFDDFEFVVVTAFWQDEVVFEERRDAGEKKFDLGNFDFCPEVEVKFLDTTGLWTSEAVELVCFEKSRQIRFSEVLPRPKEIDWNKDGLQDLNDEWIELTNLSDRPVDLSYWRIKDAAGKNYLIKDAIIDSGGFVVFFKSQTKIALNDTGEELFLIDPEGEIVDELIIPRSTSRPDQSYALWKGEWHWTLTPTLGEANKITLKELSASPPSASSRNAVAPPAAKSDGEAAEASEETSAISEVEKTITTVTSSRFKITPPAFKPLVLSSQSERALSRTFNFKKFLLQLLSLAAFVIIILIYDFPRQRRAKPT